MGSSYGISCRECDYTKNFKMGIGMMYSPENLIDFEAQFPMLPHLIRSKKMLAHIKGLLGEKNAVIADGYGHKIYRCQKCGEFYERFYIHLNYGGDSFEVEYKCTKCKVALRTIDYDVTGVDGWEEKEINIEKYPCPKCDKHSLYEDGKVEIMWD